MIIRIFVNNYIFLSKFLVAYIYYSFGREKNPERILIYHIFKAINNKMIFIQVYMVFKLCSNVTYSTYLLRASSIPHEQKSNDIVNIKSSTSLQYNRVMQKHFHFSGTECLTKILKFCWVHWKLARNTVSMNESNKYNFLCSSYPI